VASQVFARQQPSFTRFLWYRSIGARNGHGKIRKFHGFCELVIIAVTVWTARKNECLRALTDSMFLNIHCLLGLSTSAAAALPPPT